MSFKVGWQAGDSGVLAWMDSVGAYFNNMPSVVDFGATGDGTTDDTQAFLDAIAASKTILVPYSAAPYLIASELTITDNHRVIGFGATLKAVATTDYLLGNVAAFDPTQFLQVEGLILDGNGLATNCLQLYGISNASSLIQRIWTKNAVQDGVALSRCQGGSWLALRGSGNGRNGFRFEGCNSAVFMSISAKDNDGDGVFVTSYQGGSPSGACEVVGIHSESNGGSGIVFDTVLARFLVRGGWVERNTKHGVHVKDCPQGGTIEGMRISGVGTSEPENHAIHLENSPKGCYAHGNFLAREGGVTSYGQVYQDTASASNVVSPNWDGIGSVLP